VTVSETNTTKSGGGIGFVGLLTILFIALKLTGYISWSWWWVLSPLWISALVFVGIIVAVLIGAVVVAVARGR
jgi:hypothetical protein